MVRSKIDRRPEDSKSLLTIPSWFYKIASTTPLLEVLKTHKGEVLNDPHFLIDQTLQEIDKKWQPGTLSNLKAIPEAWQRMLSIESEINRVALARDIDGLKKALETYKGLFSVLDSGEGQRNLFGKQDVV